MSLGHLGHSSEHVAAQDRNSPLAIILRSNTSTSWVSPFLVRGFHDRSKQYDMVTSAKRWADAMQIEMNW